MIRALAWWAWFASDRYISVVNVHARDIVMYLATMVLIHYATRLDGLPFAALCIALIWALDNRRRLGDPRHPYHQRRA